MLKRLWFELNKPRKLWDVTNIIGYVIIAWMVVTLNSLAYSTGEHVGVKLMQREAVEHHCGMWNVFADNKWYWRDEWIKMTGTYPFEITPEVQEKLKKQQEAEKLKQDH
jgi:hypothetical protein